MPGKRPRNATAIPSARRERKAITLDVKLEVLRRFEVGEKLSQVAKALGLAVSTVATIRDNKEKIKASSQIATPLRASRLTRHRSAVMETMERLLRVWLEDQSQRNVPLSVTVIQEKAKSLFDDLQREQGEGSQTAKFSASKGWFVRFKERHCLPHFKMSSTAPGKEDVYPEILKSIIQEGEYTPQQVFNVDETGLYWKRMPERTFISIEEKAEPGFKSSKDRLMLLLGGNAAGDFKLKPLLVYHSESPKALEGYSKPNLPVIWRSNKKAWATRSIFHEWFTYFFCPAIEKYCAQNNLANKALLILDSAPCHPVNLSDLSDNVRVEYLHDNTADSIQPMGQGVASTFKAHYLRRTFEHILEATDGDDTAEIREFWRRYSIMDAVDNIAIAWEELRPATMNSVWKKIWPECVQFHSVSQTDNIAQLQQNIVTLAKSVALGEVGEADVDQLLRSHEEGLSNEELVQLEQEPAGEEEEGEEAAPALRQLTTRELSAAFSHFEAGLQVLTSNSPNEAWNLKVSRAIYDAISCYRDLYSEKERRSKQF
ncbi:tigger transposable element-derived protein 1 [Physeter macrocephalus]|uniref:Tigger transposable element-derived protein 1 n=1 Tax=Physeter macrocephalus TaxID=9755 RepID=A0A2Y9FK99_PHYMC|nr:tigger transposable element-derived protein 1 [Physeter catodon]|eukprot:XP_007125547.1 CENPB DNA-binding domain-containing protein 1 [Physeter catodon]